MNIVKRYWFPAAVVVLVGVIGFNLFTIYNQGGQNKGAGDLPEDPAEHFPEGSAGRFPAATAAAGPGVPRTFSLVVAPEDSGSKLDREALTKGLQSIGAVEQVQPDGEDPMTLRITIVEPIKLSVLSERLANHGAAVVEDRSPLRGDLRLHVSGMT